MFLESISNSLTKVVIEYAIAINLNVLKNTYCIIFINLGFLVCDDYLMFIIFIFKINLGLFFIIFNIFGSAIDCSFKRNIYNYIFVKFVIWTSFKSKLTNVSLFLKNSYLGNNRYKSKK